MEPDAFGSEKVEQTALALRHSAEIALALALLDLCIISTFDNLTVIVVDGFYNAGIWALCLARS